MTPPSSAIVSASTGGGVATATLPAFSVIIPAYNEEAAIGETID